MMCIQADALSLGASACSGDNGGPLFDKLGFLPYGVCICLWGKWLHGYTVTECGI